MKHSSKSWRGFRLLAVRPLVVLIMVLVISLPAAYGLLSSTTRISSSGTLKAVGVQVFLDNAGTSPVTSISWGTVEPGANITKVIYVKNNGNVPASLSLSTSNWNPSSTSNYVTLKWNYGGQSINPGQLT